MRLPRLTTRRLMALVALVAFGITGERLRRVAQSRYRWAVEFSHRESETRSQARITQALRNAELERAGRSDDRSPGHRTIEAIRRRYGIELMAWERQAAYFAGLRRKYERAAWRPWEPVPDDPPDPEWIFE